MDKWLWPDLNYFCPKLKVNFRIGQINRFLCMLDNDSFRFLDPRTWPWVAWMWLVFIVAGSMPSLWKRHQRRRAATWPLTQGHIETVNVTKPSKWSRKRGEAEIAEIGYSYCIDGSVYVGHYQRSFASADAAWEFLRDPKSKPITIHYNPVRLSSSSIDEDSLQTLIQARPPAPKSEFGAIMQSHFGSSSGKRIWQPGTKLKLPTSRS